MSARTQAFNCRKCGAPLRNRNTAGFCGRCLMAAVPWLSTQKTLPAGDITVKGDSGDLPYVQPSSPTRFGDYELTDEIARGGMGVIYKARDSRVNRTVALKMIRPGDRGTMTLKRFRIEVEAAAALDHPNIVPIYDFGEVEGRPFFTMKLIEGTSLDGRIRRFKKDLRAGVQMLAKVARAVNHAHQRGVLHRDLKPGNILLDAADEPFVTDFGVARRIDEQSDLTHSGMVIGTPNFMSPEQAAGKMKVLTTATDIFSLGGILYNLLTGLPPFQSETLLELLQRVQDTEPVRPTTLNRKVDRDLETICLKCLEKEPRNRYRSALELAEDLERWLGHETIQARRSTAMERAGKWMRRRPLVASLVGAVVVAILGGVVGVFQQWRQAESARGMAVQRGDSEANARRAESLQRAKAERSRRETELLLTKIELEKADHLLDAGESGGGMAYLARVLRRDPTNQAAAERLVSAFRHRPFAVPAVFSVETEERMHHSEFSPDRRQVVLGGVGESRVQLWNTITGKASTGPLIHRAPVQCVAFSPDGATLATGAMDAARLWDTQSGKMRLPRFDHSQPVVHVEFTPDGKTLLTLSDGRVRRWDAQTGQQLDELPIQKAIGIYLNRDGSLLAVKTAESVRVINFTTGEEICEPFVHDGRGNIRKVYFTPDSSRIVIEHYQYFVIRNIASPKTASVVIEVTQNVNRGALSHDGRFVAAASPDHVARVWDVATGELVTDRLFHSGVASHVAFSSDSGRLMVACRNGKVYGWDLTTGEPFIEPLKHDARLLSLEFGPDGREVLTTSVDRTVRRWALLRQSAPPMELSHPKKVREAQFSADGSLVLTACDDGVARLWDARTGRVLPMMIDHGAPLVDAAFSQDGRRIMTAGQDRTVKIWSASDGALSGGPLAQRFGIRTARFNPDATRALVALNQGVYQVWDLATGKNLHGPIVQNGRSQFNSAYGPTVFTPDGTMILFGTPSRTARLMPVNGRLSGSAQLPHTAVLEISQFSADGRRVITASEDNTARVWSVPSGMPVSESLYHDGVVRMGSLSHDGSLAATASIDRTARVWDVETGKPLGAAMQHAATVGYVEFSPDARRVVTCAEDLTANLWDARTGQPLRDPLLHSGPIHSAHFSPDGRSIVTACEDGKVRIWDIAALPLPVPEWVVSFAEVLGGEKVNVSGDPIRVAHAELAKLRDSVMARPGNDYYTKAIKELFQPAE